MIEVFKILKGFNSVNKDTWFQNVSVDGPQTRTTSYPMNLRLKTVRSDIRKNFFSQRVVPIWNSLPNIIKSAPDVIAFKTRYDKEFSATGVTG